MKLSSVLHVPSFPVNLLSVSSIIDQLNCIVIFDRNECLFQEKETGRTLGTGIRRDDGLWYLDKAAVMLAAAVSEGPEAEVMLHHCRLGHMSFDSLTRMEPELMSKVDRSKLFCNACELGKHTRSTYKMIGLRSPEPFALVHSDVWGPCPSVSISGFRWFVTFIDCYSRMTWIYMMKPKSEAAGSVLEIFKPMCRPSLG